MKKILGRLIIVAPAVIIQILWMNFLYNKLNNSALVTLLLTILAFLFVIYIILFYLLILLFYNYIIKIQWQ